jgi:hypothetical protein
MSVSEPEPLGPWDLSETEVFADRLQTCGDPRGELLSLELAAERASTSDEARRLNREAQRIRDAHRSLVWPAALAGTNAITRAGFVVGGQYQQLFAPDVPLELLLGVRQLGVEHRFEDCLRSLLPARAGGLRLDALSQASAHGRPTSLAGIRELAAIPGEGPALERLELAGPVRELEALTTLTGLRSCRFGAPLARAELSSLAPLPLTNLRLQGPLVESVLEFGETLAELELDELTGSLASLAGLPRLRSLELTGRSAASSGAELAPLARLDRLRIPALHEFELLTHLRELPLRDLSIGELAWSLTRELGCLGALEHLSIRATIGGLLDLRSLAELPRLRSLHLPSTVTGAVALPAGCERLSISDVRERLVIAGNVVELHASDCDPRCLPPTLLAGIRRLELTWIRYPQYQFAAELPRVCPNLERLMIFDVPRDGPWRWNGAPAIVRALPQLRSFMLFPAMLSEVADFAEAFPEICPLRTFDERTNARDWPRSAGDLSRAMVMTAPEPSSMRLPEDHPFSRLSSWAEHLRASGDPRGELLELELAAELSDNPAEARTLHRQITPLRARLAAVAWPRALHDDRALVRAGMPIISSGAWLDSTDPPVELLATLRAVEFGDGQRLDTCLYNLALGLAHRLRLVRLELLDSVDASYSSSHVLELLRGFKQLRELALELPLHESQRLFLPDLPLRELVLSHENFEPEFIARFAASLESLALGPCPEPTTLDGLVLPKLTDLYLAHGWQLDWALRQPNLERLALDTEDPERLDQLARMRLEWLWLSTTPSALQRVLPRLAELGSLAHLGLGWDAPPPVLELELPPSLESLTLHGPSTTVRVHGSYTQLTCSADLLEEHPWLCEGVRRLSLHPPGLGLPSRLAEYASMLEHLELHADLFDPDELPELAALPRLRTVTLPGVPLGLIAGLATMVQTIQLHGFDPGVRDPDRWPRAPA